MIEDIILLISSIIPCLAIAYILVKNWTKLVKAIAESLVETKKLLQEFRALIVEVRKLIRLFRKK